MTKPVSHLMLLISTVALAFSALAQQQENHQPSKNSNNALVQLLQSKGILSPGEVATLNQASSADELNDRLAKLLVEKGLISQQEYTATVTPVSTTSPTISDAANTSTSSARLSDAVLHTPVAQAQAQSQMQRGQPMGTPPAAGPPYISAVAPVRVLPIDAPKQGGMIPDIHLGSGANMKLYGFFKASAINDTAGSGGPTFGDQDWPLPLLIGGDTGPTSDPSFHLKARSTRFGSLFEWVPRDSGFTITAKVEADFEGDYTDVSNRNISSVRSSQFDLRMAYMRLDHKLGALPWFAEFGQDWSLMSSSLPSLFETTGLGVAMGSLYERIPQFRTGVQFHTGDLKIQPEFAIVLPVAASSALTPDQRARFGDRAGSDSDEPGVESRVVFQFPLSHNWRGVAPAQFIVSGHHAEMDEIIPHGAQAATSVTCTVLPCTINIFTNATTPNLGFTTTTSIVGASNCTGASCTLEQIFPRGTQVQNPQNVWTTELQLPTPWVTFVGKFYKGDDLRFFFGGQLNDVYSNLHGLTSVGNGISESGRSITFGCAGGITAGATVTCPGTPVQSAILQPVGGVGGFVEMSFPLSRIFHANPEGHNSGWVFHMQYGTDRANAADARASGSNGLARTDLDTVSLTYKMNTWVSFVNETSYIVTRAATAYSKTFEGLPTTQAHDWRQEFGPIFTF